MRKIKKKPGQTLLIVVLVVTMMTLSLGVIMASTSSVGLNAALKAKNSQDAYRLVETCLNDALMKLARQDLNINGSFTLEEGSCTINLTGSGPYTVSSSALVGQANRKLQATVSVSNEVVTITEFHELTN